jgi:hypothetical protein
LARNIVDFIIVGGQKCGTTAAAFNLNQHPELSIFDSTTSFNQREIEFFNQHWDAGVEWYRSNFPTTGKVVGEKTAELIHRTITHERMHIVEPSAKLILFLRNPVYRAYSQWRMAVRPGWNEVRSFRECVLEEMVLLQMSPEYAHQVTHCLDLSIDGWREGYVLKGCYIDQIEHLLKWYPRTQVHIAITEEVRQDMQSQYAEIFRFLGVSAFIGDFKTRFVGADREPMDADIAEALHSFYKPYNERLFRLLGRQISCWT